MSPLRASTTLDHAQKAIERIVDRSGVAFRGHDLRRTAASLMVGAGGFHGVSHPKQAVQLVNER
jgi:integrase